MPQPSPPAALSAEPQDDKEFEHVVLPIEGMFCAACVLRIEKVVGRVDGVQTVSVNLASERASIDFDPKAASEADLVAAVIRRSRMEMAIGKSRLDLFDPTPILRVLRPFMGWIFGPGYLLLLSEQGNQALAVVNQSYSKNIG